MATLEANSAIRITRDRILNLTICYRFFRGHRKDGSRMLFIFFGAVFEGKFNVACCFVTSKKNVISCARMFEVISRAYALMLPSLVCICRNNP